MEIEVLIDDFIDNFRKPERFDEFKQLARQFDFRYRNKEKFASQPYFLKGFNLFRGKKPKRLKAVLLKKEPAFNGVTRIYDYFYFGEFKKRQTTVFELQCKEFDFARFEITPKGTLDQIQDFFVGKDKPFPQEKDFHGKYEVDTRDHYVFEGQIGRAALNQIAERKGLHIEGHEDYLLVYFHGRKIPSQEIMQEYDFVLDLVDNILYDYNDDIV